MLCVEYELGDGQVVGDVRERRVAAVYLSHGRRRADGGACACGIGKERGAVRASPLSLGFLYTGRFPGASA